MQKTLYDKLWENQVIHVEDDGTTSPGFDRHRVHKVTSPQSFEGWQCVGGRIHPVSPAIAWHFIDMRQLH
jgi:3-isopropylmalate/(R)-2-methylmalate dehydratase large subunit